MSSRWTVIGAGLVVVLLLQNRQLRGRVPVETAVTARTSVTTHDAPVEAGTTVSAVVGTDTQSRTSRIETSGPLAHGALIVTVSNEIDLSSDTTFRLASVLDAGRSSGLDVVWVSRDRVQSGTWSMHVAKADSVILDPSYRTWASLQMDAVPQLILVAKTGAVEAVWPASLTANTAAEAKRAIEAATLKKPSK